MEWNRCPAELSLPSYPPRCQPWEWSHFRSSRSDQPEKAMAPHSSTLAWKILWMEEPGRLQSMGSLSRTRLSDFTFTFRFHALEKEMATHSSVLAWRIPGMGGPGGLPSMGSHRVGHDWSDLATRSDQQSTKCYQLSLVNAVYSGITHRSTAQIPGPQLRWIDSITESTNMSLSKLWETTKDREAWHAAAHGVRKSWTQLSNWTMTTVRMVDKMVVLNPWISGQFVMQQ